jgi:PAS domain S-box-containing protein
MAIDPLAAFEAIGEGILSLAADETCTYINPAGAALLGFAPEEIRGRPLHALIHHSRPDGTPYPPEACPIRRALATGESCRVEDEVFWRKDLSPLPVTYTVVPVRVGEQVTGATVLFQDASRHRQTVEELARERAARLEAERAQERLAFLARAGARLAAALEPADALTALVQLAVPRLADWCAVDLVRVDGTVERAAAAHVDPGRTALVQALRRDYPLVHRPGAGEPTAPETVARVLASGQTEVRGEIADRELIAMARDAAELALLRAVGVFSLLCIPLARQGQTIGAVLLVHGASRRRYQPADVALAEDLVRQAGAALASASRHDAARETARLRTHLLAVAAHDLRGPLADIKGFAQLALRRSREITAPEVEPLRTALERIDASATRMADLIAELLDVARIQAGQPLTLQRQPTDLAALARQVVERFQQTAPRCRIILAADEPAPVGHWDPRRLERVLATLVENAVIYSPEGGDVTVRVGVDDPAAPTRAIVSVADRGIGIPAADLPHIFEDFFRARNVADRIPGTGIGLAAARRIVEQHGGTISVESTEGVGSTFTVQLPLAPPAPS